MPKDATVISIVVRRAEGLDVPEELVMLMVWVSARFDELTISPTSIEFVRVDDNTWRARLVFPIDDPVDEDEIVSILTADCRLLQSAVFSAWVDD